ncbi:MAG: cytochrome-c peroxidase [Deltaproteobacteria bacterium]|nr:MAG: cytochrome-c peroxidase [Deltaproteobacteria bacterium]
MYFQLSIFTKSKTTNIFIELLVTLTICACSSDKVSLYEPTPYYLNIPTNYPTMDIPENNQMTYEGIELGRKLYYDKKLHPNQSMSCSSCHNQQTSFTTFSSNSLPHINLGFYDKYLWNGQVEGTLEDIMLFEVDFFFQTNLDLLREDDEYPNLFFRAFGSTEITSKKTAYALAQFLRTVNSFESRYDLQLQGLATMTPEEWDGFDIFYTERGDCFHCHSGVLFTDNLFHNNGLDINPSLGRSEVTFNPSDVGKYKTPTLKNIEYTGPYMHDGRFQSLEEVVEFYSTGLNWSSTIDPLMINVGSGGVNLTSEEKNNLVLFLKTLSDVEFLNNSNLSNPN